MPLFRTLTQCAACVSERLCDVFGAHCLYRRHFSMLTWNFAVLNFLQRIVTKSRSAPRQARGGEICRLSYKFNQAWTDVQMKRPSLRRVQRVCGRLELRFFLYAFLLTIFRARLRRFAAVLPRRASRVSCGTRLRAVVSCNFVQSVESALWRRNLSFQGLTFFSLRV